MENVTHPLAARLPPAPVASNGPGHGAQTRSIQKALANLQDACFQLIQARMAVGDWAGAQQAARALAKIEPDYRDVGALSDKIVERWAEDDKQKQQLAESQRKIEAKRQSEEKARQVLNALQLVRVPAGSFLCGEDKKQVYLQAFAIGKYPVTVAQFALFVELSGYNHSEAVQFALQKANHPVANVSWNDASAFCEWASQLSGKVFSLPDDHHGQPA